MTQGRFRVAGATDLGRVRQVNEDAYALCPDQGLFVVCDGMGGAMAGEVASRLAVETIVEQLSEAAGNTVAIPAAEQGYRSQTSRLAEAMRRSNARIYTQARDDSRQAGMGTTAVGALITQDIASVAHVGDSRAYLWRNDCFEPLTNDHSFVEEQVRAGLLDRDQSLQSAHQNILLRALGLESTVEVELNEVPLRSGDYLLLCSDGLTRMVPEVAMAQAIARWRDPQRICKRLITAANGNGGADNITVVVVEIVGSWRERLSTYWKRLASKGRDVKADSEI